MEILYRNRVIWLQNRDFILFYYITIPDIFGGIDFFIKICGIYIKMTDIIEKLSLKLL